MVFLVVIFFMSVSFAPLSASQREAYRIPPRRPAFSYHLRGSILRSFGWGSGGSVGKAILPAAAFQAAFRDMRESSIPKRRLKAGGSQDWLPHKAAEPQPRN